MLSKRPSFASGWRGRIQLIPDTATQALGWQQPALSGLSALDPLPERPLSAGAAK